MTDTDLEQTAELTERGETDVAVREPTIFDMMRLAVEQGEKGVKALHGLMDLKERDEANKARVAFNAAMAAFQAECPPIPKTMKAGEGGGLAYDYADRATVATTISPFAAKHGLSYSFDMKIGAEQKEYMVCTVRHEAGHEKPSMVPIVHDAKGRMGTIQQGGAAREYAMRYSLLQAFGLSATSADTDGVAPSNVKTIDAEQAANIHALVDEVGNPRIIKNILTLVGVEKVEEVPADRYREIVKMLQAKVK